MKNKDLEDLKQFFESQKQGRRDCPDCNPRSRCPYCDPSYRRPDPWHESRCVLHQPLMMVIPPEGVHLSCPIHPEGHHVFGPAISWMSKPRFEKTAKPWCEYDMTYRPIDYNNDQSKAVTFDSSKNRIVEFDSTRPYGTCTGDKIF